MRPEADAGTPAAPAVELRRHAGAEAAGLADDLADLYQDARAEPLFDGPLWTREAFLRRLRQQLVRPGFTLVTAHLGGPMVGIAFGLPFPAGRWWAGESTPPPAEVLAAARFAVVDLDVRSACRNRGIGRALLDELLAGRPERYAMLSTMPHSPARLMYQRWGWRQVAVSRPPGGPLMHTLVLPLPVGSGWTRP
ncbi:GNAT family N-acetyltransferase [Plantactinospora sp. CA-290183]|uniref:GNAT family N-acetyltransferase n=1 Tax=Plantactinospora sp. CA-290183 TaxID=3240006 RepID=UPI003D8FD687